MKYLSLFSGIEAASCAWQPLGWEAVAFSEIDPSCCKLLEHRYPNVENLGDVEQVEEWPGADLVVGGSPCQSFSVAGKRLGLADPRGNLALEFLRVVASVRPRWFCFENVPGLLHSDEGRDFGTFLAAVAELGYGFAYRVLDAQYFGVPQRRRRVFVVGHLGDWRPSVEALFEPSCLRRDPPPRCEEGERIAAPLAHGTGGWRVGADEAVGGQLIVDRMNQRVGDALPTVRGGDGGETLPLVAAFNIYPSTGQGSELEASLTDQAAGLSSVTIGSSTERGTRVVSNTGIRRLSVLETERAFGFPDHYTAVPGLSDSARYRALGNSMVVPVMRWIGERISATLSI